MSFLAIQVRLREALGYRGRLPYAMLHTHGSFIFRVVWESQHRALCKCVLGSPGVSECALVT
jgi:hypothetical protein